MFWNRQSEIDSIHSLPYLLDYDEYKTFNK